MTKPKIGTLIVRQSHSFSYANALVRNIFKRPVGWKPTGTKQNLSLEYLGLLHFKSLYLTAYIALISAAIALHRFPLLHITYYSVLSWIIFALLINGILLQHAYRNANNFLQEESVEKSQRVRWLTKHAAPYVALMALMPVTALAYSLRYPSTEKISVTASAVSVDHQAMQPSDDAVVLEQPAMVPTSTEATVPVSRQTQNIKITALRGDSIFTLARKAVDEYRNENNISLLPWERIFIETSLTESKMGMRVKVGMQLNFTEDQIKHAIRGLSSVSASQIKKWNAYARMAGI
jgi:hypothetical protein